MIQNQESIRKKLLPEHSDENGWFGRLLEPHARLTDMADRLGARLFIRLLLVHIGLALISLFVVNAIWLQTMSRPIWFDQDTHVVITSIGSHFISLSLIKTGRYRTGVLLYVIMSAAVPLVAPFVPDPHAEIGLLAVAIFPVIIATIAFPTRRVLAILIVIIFLGAFQIANSDLSEEKIITGAILLLAVAVSSSMVIVFRQHLMTLENRRIALIKAGERQYRDLFGSIIDAVLLTDRQGKILEANSAAYRMLDYSQEELRGERIETLLGNATVRGEIGLWDMIEKESDLLEIDLQCKNGNLLPVELTASRVDFRGQAAILIVARNITDRKRAEVEKKQLRDQLLQLQKMEAIGTLAGGIAHDFNNILGGIIGYAELAIEDKEKETVQLDRYLSRILEAGNRARNLVKQILSFSRQGTSSQVPLNLVPLVKEGIKLLESILPKTITVEIDLHATEDTILADPTQIHQVVMNLSTNAYHAMRAQGGHLRFILENVQLHRSHAHLGQKIEPGDYVKLSVRDTGPGIPIHLLRRIFDPYFTTKEVNEGTGLGLSVSHGIVSSHKGMIEVEETSSSGTTFSVYLPVAQTPPVLPTAEKLPLISGDNEHILLIDDEAFFLDVLCETLTSLGYRVSAFQDSRQAIEQFRSAPNSFDMIVTDQTMPGMTGVQLITEARKIAPRIPVVLCTGYSESVTEETAAQHGIDGFLMKPVNRRDLTRVIHDLLHAVRNS